MYKCKGMITYEEWAMTCEQWNKKKKTKKKNMTTWVLYMWNCESTYKVYEYFSEPECSIVEDILSSLIKGTHWYMDKIMLIGIDNQKQRWKYTYKFVFTNRGYWRKKKEGMLTCEHWVMSGNLWVVRLAKHLEIHSLISYNNGLLA